MVLWDTNAVIYLLDEKPDSPQKLILDDIYNLFQAQISDITEIELLSWRSPSPYQWEALNRFIDNSEVLGLSKEVKHKTAEIRRTTRVKVPDAIIAATAIVNGLYLITRNTKDFAPIVELKVLNPWEVI